MLENGDEVKSSSRRRRPRRQRREGRGDDRQGARRHPSRHPRRGAQPVCRAGPPHRRAALPARQDRPIRTKRCRARCCGSRAVDQGGDRPSAAARCGPPTWRAPCRSPRLQGGARRRDRAAAEIESGWFGLKRSKAVKVKVPGEAGGSDPDPRHQHRPAGALRAQRRRGAGRSSAS